MFSSTLRTHRIASAAFAATFLLIWTESASAFPQTQAAWQERYGAASSSADSARCQLCHGNANGGNPWNGYGWDIRDALADPACDFDASGDVGNDEAFFCVEMLNSDEDGAGFDNATETGLSTQPGWTEGAFNSLFFDSGLVTMNQLAPADIGVLDPDGSEPPPPPPPPPPGDDDDLPPGQLKRRTIVVRPGDSIQAAIDRAQHGTTVYVLGGVYREPGNPTNGLNITKSGIRLVGQSNPRKRVILESTGDQRNGIVVVPEDRVDCMNCHTDMAPPFPLRPGVTKGLKMREPMMKDLEIRGITIRGFPNNGLFTENVDGFDIIDVESIDNKNYGIFPTLSKNGIVTHSYASGSDDSGIWVETSENVRVTHNLVEDNVNGFEVSNSDDILLSQNEARENTVGFAILLLPDIFDDRAGARRIDVKDNWIHDNNRENTARPGSILSFVPSGVGVLYIGVDDSEISGNRVENNSFSGVAVADYCVTVAQTASDCALDPSVTPEFIADQSSDDNHVIDNVLVDNGTEPVPHPFDFAASDLTLITIGDHGNCFSNNEFSTSFSLVAGGLPACPEELICGLGGELILLLPPLIWLNRRRRRVAP